MEVWDQASSRGQPLGAGQALAVLGSADCGKSCRLAGTRPQSLTFGVTAEGCGPAPLHRRHDTALNAPEMAVMVAAIVRAVAVEDIRYFQIGTHGGRLNRGRHDLDVELVKRTDGSANHSR